MKLVWAFFVSALLGISLLFLGRVALAQDAYEDIPEATLAQDSPFYFLRGWQEGIERFFARSDAARTNLEIRHAQRRVAEMRRLARLGQENLLAKAEERWQSHLARAQERAEKLTERRDEIREKILEQMDRHVTVMERVREQVPEEAKEAIDRAIENYTTNREELLNRFSSPDRSEIETRLKQRLENTIDRFQLRRDRFQEILEK